MLVLIDPVIVDECKESSNCVDGKPSTEEVGSAQVIFGK